MLHRVLGDVLIVVVYAASLLYPDMPWVLSGFHLAMQHGLQEVNHRVLMVTLLQVSNSCDSRRMLLTDGIAAYVTAICVAMALVARTSAFASMDRRAKGTGIILVCTLALAARHERYGGHLLEVARVLLFIVLSHVSPRELDDWTMAGRTAWVLACHYRPFLAVAMLQIIADAEVPLTQVQVENLRRKKLLEVETWDLRMV